MEVPALAAIVLIAFGAAAVQSTIGFGYALLFAPLAALIVQPREAIAASLLTGTALSLGLFWEHRPRAPFRRVAPLAIAGVVGTPLGLLLLLRLDAATLHLLVGAGVIVSALIGLARRREEREERTERLPLAAATGLLSGLMRGAVSFPGPPIVLYQHWVGGSPADIRARMFAYLVLTAVPGVLMAWWSGILTSVVWLMGLVGLPAIAAGIAAGRRVRGVVSAAAFARLSMALLVLASAASVAGALTAWQRTP